MVVSTLMRRSHPSLLLRHVHRGRPAETTVFEDLPALVLSNDKIALTVITEGGAMAQIVLADDKEKINPLWNPYWIARQAGLSRPASFFRGHFVCIDGFGPVVGRRARCGPAVPRRGVHAAVAAAVASEERRHAERRVLGRRCRSHTKRSRGPITSSTARTSSGSTARSPACWRFDRPVFWGEHATISAPFLEPGKVAVDMPVIEIEDEGVSGAAEADTAAAVVRRFHLADGADGRRPEFDVRTAPMKPNTTDHTTTLLDPSRRLGFVTALHPEKRLLIGWVFRREEFPWVQTWLSNPGPNRMTRGLEFATQPFDLRAPRC